MGSNSYLHVILGVLTNFYVIGTAVVLVLVIEFAKFVTSYRKRPPKPKGKKAPKAAAPAATEKTEEKAESGEKTSDTEEKAE